MKPCTIYLFRFISIIAISLILVGCTITHTIKSADLLPNMQAGSPLRSVSPKTFAFKEFKDVRGADPLLVAKGMGHEFKLEQPLTTLVATAIKNEFERNGHTCVLDTPQSKSDFIIEGTVYKYQWQVVQHSFSMEVIGDVEVKLTIISAHDRHVLMAKNYAGEYHVNTSFKPISLHYEVMKQASLSMIKEISTDPELVQFIDSNPKKL